MKDKTKKLCEIVVADVQNIGRQLFALQPEGFPKLGPYVFVFLASIVMVFACQFLTKPSKMIVFPLFLFFVLRSWNRLRFVESRQGPMELKPSLLLVLAYPPLLYRTLALLLFLGSFVFLLTDTLYGWRVFFVPFTVCLGLFFWKDTDSKFF